MDGFCGRRVTWIIYHFCFWKENMLKMKELGNSEMVRRQSLRDPYNDI